MRDPRPHREQLPHVAEVADDWPAGPPARGTPRPRWRREPRRRRRRTGRVRRPQPTRTAPATAATLAAMTTGRQSTPAYAADRPEQERQRDPDGQRADHDADGQPALATEPAGGELHRHGIGGGQGHAGQEPERDGRGRVGRDEREAEVGRGRHERPAANSLGPEHDVGAPTTASPMAPTANPSRTTTVRNGRPSGPTAHSSRRIGATADAANDGDIARTIPKARIVSAASARSARSIAGSRPDGRSMVYTTHVPRRTSRAVGSAGDAAQRRDRLVRARLDDLGLGGHGVADVGGRRIVPLLVQEHAARPGRTSATSALNRPVVRPPWTMSAPGRVRAAKSDRSGAGCGRR